MKLADIPPATATGDAPRKRGRPPGRKRTAKSSFTPAQVKAMLAGLLIGASGVAGMVFPAHWTEDDQLTQDETTILVQAIYAELEQYPQALRWLQAMAVGGVHVQLAMALMAVAAPRLARHGVIPAEFGNAIAGMAGLATTTSTRMETGGASGDSRPDSNGQEHAGEPPVVVPGLYSSIPLETGLDALYGGPGDIESGAHGRHQGQQAGAAT